MDLFRLINSKWYWGLTLVVQGIGIEYVLGDVVYQIVLVTWSSSRIISVISMCV
jgi:hypothetical protein